MATDKPAAYKGLPRTDSPRAGDEEVGVVASQEGQLAAAPGGEKQAEKADALRMLARLRQGAIIVPLLLVVLFGITTWRSTVQEAEARAIDNAVLVREYVQRLVKTQELALTAAEEAVTRFRPEGGYDRATHLYLRALAGRTGSGFGIALVDSDGEFVLSSAAHPARSGLDRASLDHLRAGVDEIALFVDRMLPPPFGGDSLLIARPSEGAGLDGIWISAVRVDALREFLTRIVGREGDSASIIRGDGRVLVRHVQLDGATVLGPETPTATAINSGDRGVYHGASAIDGVTRICGFERLPGLDLYAHFGVSKRGLLREWAVGFGTVALLLGTIGFVAFNLARFAERNVRAEAAQAALVFDRRLLAEAEKTAALKDTMLRELNHRVKNSLQMIQSLIRLQRSREGEPDLEGISARVMAIAAIHDLLYRSSRAFDVDFATLLREISASEAMRPPEGNVTVRCRADPLVLDVGLATPLALCAVELMTNAAKHAFGAEGGRIDVVLEHRQGAATARLVVSDNGIGIPEQPGRNSGLRVVDAFLRQVDGTMTLARDGGTRFEIVFPVPEPEGTGARGQD